MQEPKVSVIIPTLWRSDVTVQLVNTLLDWPLLEELIIIDNDPGSRPHHTCWKHCTVLEQEDNIYVNPAWNLGVRTAKENIIAICNDDICFNPRDLDRFIRQLKPNEIWGLHEDSILKPESINQPELRTGFIMGLGWGCLMLMRRGSYIPIPQNIKVWYGDDWLVHCTNVKKSIRMRVEGTLSVSASDTKFNPIKEEDQIHYSQLIWHPLYRSLRILCRSGLKYPLKLALRMKKS